MHVEMTFDAHPIDQSKQQKSANLPNPETGHSHNKYYLYY